MAAPPFNLATCASKLPFPDGTFDGIVSAYAIDHLSHDGIKAAFHEANRVLTSC